jgi:hypothetical protein
MKTLFLFFNADGTIKTGAIRVDGKKIPDMAIWEVWEFYQILVDRGYKPIIVNGPNGPVHMIIY